MATTLDRKRRIGRLGRANHHFLFSTFSNQFASNFFLMSYTTSPSCSSGSSQKATSTLQLKGTRLPAGIDAHNRHPNPLVLNRNSTLPVLRWLTRTETPLDSINSLPTSTTIGINRKLTLPELLVCRATLDPDDIDSQNSTCPNVCCRLQE
ncbi:unnamed protein product, partial [Mesorhabditis belari]|uniref:Uncharacterized protein n=1 Tax=Mesorhabditis belari TaxID=2138241 RepID=A0AAF3FPW9_9BILA